MTQFPRVKHKKKPLSGMIEKLLRYGAEIQEWTSVLSLEEWREDIKSVRATAMNLQIIGEEINTLLIVWEDLLILSDISPVITMEKWQSLRYLRHGISHGYDCINEINFYRAARDFADVLKWANSVEKHLNKIETEEKLKDNPRLVFSPYIER